MSASASDLRELVHDIRSTAHRVLKEHASARRRSAALSRSAQSKRDRKRLARTLSRSKAAQDGLASPGAITTATSSLPASPAGVEGFETPARGGAALASPNRGAERGEQPPPPGGKAIQLSPLRPREATTTTAPASTVMSAPTPGGIYTAKGTASRRGDGTGRLGATGGITGGMSTLRTEPSRSLDSAPASRRHEATTGGKGSARGGQSWRKGAAATSRGASSQKALSPIRSQSGRRRPPSSATTGGRKSAGARVSSQGGLAQRIHSSPLMTDAFDASEAASLRRRGRKGPESSPSLAWGPESGGAPSPHRKLTQADSTLRQGAGRRDDPRTLAAAATAALGRSVLHRPEHALPSRLDPAVWCDPKRQAATDSGLRSMPYHMHQLEIQGPANWDSADLRLRHRDWDARQQAWAASLRQRQAAEQSIAEGGSPLQVVDAFPHPLYTAYLAQVEEENTECRRRARARNAALRPTFDVEVHWRVAMPRIPFRPAVDASVEDVTRMRRQALLAARQRAVALREAQAATVSNLIHAADGGEDEAAALQRRFGPDAVRLARAARARRVVRWAPGPAALRVGVRLAAHAAWPLCSHAGEGDSAGTAVYGVLEVYEEAAATPDGEPAAGGESTWSACSLVPTAVGEVRLLRWVPLGKGAPCSVVVPAREVTGVLGGAGPRCLGAPATGTGDRSCDGGGRTRASLARVLASRLRAPLLRQESGPARPWDRRDGADTVGLRGYDDCLLWSGEAGVRVGAQCDTVLAPPQAWMAGHACVGDAAVRHALWASVPGSFAVPMARHGGEGEPAGPAAASITVFRDGDSYSEAAVYSDGAPGGAGGDSAAAGAEAEAAPAAGEREGEEEEEAVPLASAVPSQRPALLAVCAVSLSEPFLAGLCASPAAGVADPDTAREVYYASESMRIDAMLLAAADWARRPVPGAARFVPGSHPAPHLLQGALMAGEGADPPLVRAGAGEWRSGVWMEPPTYVPVAGGAEQCVADVRAALAREGALVAARSAVEPITSLVAGWRHGTCFLLSDRVEEGYYAVVATGARSDEAADGASRRWGAAQDGHAFPRWLPAHRPVHLSDTRAVVYSMTSGAAVPNGTLPWPQRCSWHSDERATWTTASRLKAVLEGVASRGVDAGAPTPRVFHVLMRRGEAADLVSQPIDAQRRMAQQAQTLAEAEQAERDLRDRVGRARRRAEGREEERAEVRRQLAAKARLRRQRLRGKGVALCEPAGVAAEEDGGSPREKQGEEEEEEEEREGVAQEEGREGVAQGEDWREDMDWASATSSELMERGAEGGEEEEDAGGEGEGGKGGREASRGASRGSVTFAAGTEGLGVDDELGVPHSGEGRGRGASTRGGSRRPGTGSEEGGLESLAAALAAHGGFVRALAVRLGLDADESSLTEDAMSYESRMQRWEEEEEEKEEEGSEWGHEEEEEEKEEGGEQEEEEEKGEEGRGEVPPLPLSRADGGAPSEEAGGPEHGGTRVSTAALGGRRRRRLAETSSARKGPTEAELERLEGEVVRLTAARAALHSRVESASNPFAGQGGEADGPSAAPQKRPETKTTVDAMPPSRRRKPLAGPADPAEILGERSLLSSRRSERPEEEEGGSRRQRSQRDEAAQAEAVAVWRSLRASAVPRDFVAQATTPHLGGPGVSRPRQKGGGEGGGLAQEAGTGTVRGAMLAGLVDPLRAYDHEQSLVPPSPVIHFIDDLSRERMGAQGVQQEGVPAGAGAAEPVSQRVLQMEQPASERAAAQAKIQALTDTLISATRNNRVEEAESALDDGAEVDGRDEYGNTALIVAAQNGLKRLVRVLLRRGATLNTANLSGNTPLHFAYMYGFESLGEYLKEKGADDTVVNGDGLTCYEGLGLGRDVLDEEE